MTAGDEINAALRLLGIIAEGETPSAETSADALSALNVMIDAWSASRLSVFSTQNQQFTWPSSTATRTVGATGQLSGIYPVNVDKSSYYILDGISFPLEIITQQQYDDISLKTLSSTYPRCMFVNSTVPDVTLTLYPIPDRAIELHLVSIVELVQPATLATVLSVPRGYQRAFKFNLAVEIASEFGIEPSRTVQRIAQTSLKTIKRANSDGVSSMMSLPYGLAKRFADVITF